MDSAFEGVQSPKEDIHKAIIDVAFFKNKVSKEGQIKSKTKTV